MTRVEVIRGLALVAMALVVVGLVACSGAPTVEGPGMLGPYLADSTETMPTVAEGRGRLDRKDSVIDRDTYGDHYSFVGEADQAIRVQLESSDFDTYLLLYDAAGGVVAEDDDSGSGLNSQLSLMLPNDGVYLVVATSYVRDTGEYTLVVERVSDTGRYPVLSMSDDLSRQFGAEARLDNQGNPYHIYAIDLVGGVDAQFGMTSSEADTLLRLFDGNGREVAMDDDSGGNLNSLLQFRAPSSARYYLVATTYSPPRDWGATSYQLSVSQ